MDLKAIEEEFLSRERKGSLLLRSNHMKYSRCTFNTGWDADRESDPKDYDICAASDKERNLLKATYHRIGNSTDGSYKGAETTQQEAMAEVGKLKGVFTPQEIHHIMLDSDCFDSGNASMDQREATLGTPLQGHGSILPRHPPDHGKMSLDTTHKVNYKYPFEWTPRTPSPPDNRTETKFRHGLSEFTDNDGHKRLGQNKFRDSYGS